MNDSKIFWALLGLVVGFLIWGNRVRHVPVRVTDNTNDVPVAPEPDHVLVTSYGGFPPVSSSCPGGCGCNGGCR